MEILIWRWSTAVQLTSLVMIAVFFVALTRSVGLVRLRWWVLAWVANLLALGVTVTFWLAQPDGSAVRWLLRALYMASKTAFVLCLIQGAWMLKRPGDRLVDPRQGFGWLIAYALVAASLTPGIGRLGAVQQGVLGVLFAIGAHLILRPPVEDGMRWLAIGFLVRSVLSFVESAAYGVGLFAEGTFSPELYEWAGGFTAAHSSFDSGTEWFIALGCVLALSGKTQRELGETNRALLQAQEGLRQIADRDPLTTLGNRRTMPSVLRSVQPDGAMLLFFDLDHFKDVNDLHGHQVGDDCLKAFSDSLRECFRPRDSLFRYAGDEFLVVAGGCGDSWVGDRIDRLREIVERRCRAEGLPALEFSVGVSELGAGGRPDEALKEADASMYRAKAAKRQVAGAKR